MLVLFCCITACRQTAVSASTSVMCAHWSGIKCTLFAGSEPADAAGASTSAAADRQPQEAAQQAPADTEKQAEADEAAGEAPRRSARQSLGVKSHKWAGGNDEVWLPCCQCKPLSMKLSAGQEPA